MENQDGPPSATSLFGKATVVFAGDWRQILPVIPRASRAEIVGACLKQSYIWGHCQELTLTENVRARLAGGQVQEYADYLLDLGEGKLPIAPGTEFSTQVPEELQIFGRDHGEGTLHDLTSFVFEDHDMMRSRPDYAEWVAKRGIVCPTNKQADQVNNAVMEHLKLAPFYLHGYDRVPENSHLIQRELLKKETPNGFPPNTLKLAVGASVMLLRNMDPAGGNVNGTRYVVMGITRNLLCLKDVCLLYTSPNPRDLSTSRMPSSA